MKFHYALYELQPKRLQAEDPLPPARKGALMKIDWGQDRVGFSDLHPWPELGDPELDFHLSELRSSRVTNLMEQAIWLASRDAKGRQERANIFEDQPSLKNNALITRVTDSTQSLLPALEKAGFKTLKLKVGQNSELETDFINQVSRSHNFKLRLDFNGRLTFGSFQKYMEALSKIGIQQVEYVEDPFPYEPVQWEKARTIAPIAIDWELKKIPYDQTEPVQADVLILKPTHDDIQKRVDQALRWNSKMTITSHMGHPLGVMQCMEVAQELHKKYPNYLLSPGCLTFNVFEPTDFHPYLNLQGPHIRKVGGWGIGFDFILKSLKWNQLQTQ